MEDSIPDHVYYISTQNTLSIVPQHIHDRFCKYIIAKHCGKVGDFYWEYKTEEQILEDFLFSFENNEIVYLGEL